jgi:hypothetical protein
MDCRDVSSKKRPLNGEATREGEIVMVKFRYFTVSCRIGVARAERLFFRAQFDLFRSRHQLQARQ